MRDVGAIRNDLVNAKMAVVIRASFLGTTIDFWRS
jgi:hypothetical protein